MEKHEIKACSWKTVLSNQFLRCFKGNLKGMKGALLFMLLLCCLCYQNIKTNPFGYKKLEFWAHHFEWDSFFPEMSVCEELWVWINRNGMGERKKEKAISGKTNIWEMTAYRRVKPEGGTANASQRHWEDSSCGRWNNSSLQTGWQDDCMTARRGDASALLKNSTLTCGEVTCCEKHPTAQNQLWIPRPSFQISPVLC